MTEGFVFIGRRVELYARPGYGRLVLGRWVHLGDENRLRAHEGTLRVGDKVVLGRDNTVNCYLDVEIGDATIVADWVYVCDFDHVYEDLTAPIKDQGIVKSPVRIGPDCWVGAKATVLRGSIVGEGCVLAAHTVVRGDVPPYSIVGGVSREGAQGPSRGLRGGRGQAPRPRRHRREDRASRRPVRGPDPAPPMACTWWPRVVGMRAIGLVGGLSWESTAVYYRLLNERTRDALGPYHQPVVIVHSVDFSEVVPLQQAGDWPAAGAILAEAARGLVAAGAGVVGIGANTMHIVAGEVVGRAASGRPAGEPHRRDGGALSSAGLLRGSASSARRTRWRRPSTPTACGPTVSRCVRRTPQTVRRCTAWSTRSWSGGSSLEESRSGSPGDRRLWRTGLRGGAARLHGVRAARPRGR